MDVYAVTQELMQDILDVLKQTIDTHLPDDLHSRVFDVMVCLEKLRLRNPKEMVIVTDTFGAHTVPMDVCVVAHRMLCNNTNTEPTINMFHDVMGYDLQLAKEVVECIRNNLREIGDVEECNIVF